MEILFAFLIGIVWYLSGFFAAMLVCRKINRKIWGKADLNKGDIKFCSRMAIGGFLTVIASLYYIVFRL